LLGSVSDLLARKSPAPVLVVPAPSRAEKLGELAWACKGCGHIVARFEPHRTCMQCGRSPAEWYEAPLDLGRPDPEGPHAANVEREQLASEQTNSPSALFATSPPGSGGCAVNPELKVRY
jgi:hypothetical protein